MERKMKSWNGLGILLFHSILYQLDGQTPPLKHGDENPAAVCIIQPVIGRDPLGHMPVATSHHPY